ncbi:MAG TPA: ABC transporter substrate-binding protein [Thermoleophilia bacterium]|nr:ABC transporter substrate-binding protein [Thermoleophilia bacterium]
MTRRTTTSRLLLVAAVLLAASLVWGLASALADNSSPSPASSKVVLKVGWTSEPDNLNPFVGWATTTYEIWTVNYNFLFGFDGQTFRPTLGLAAQFPTEANGGISPDGKVWTVHLKPDLKWSDGLPLTAADVAFTYNYVVKNHMANMALTTVGITGAKEIDPTTVEIDCSQPKADMESIFLPILPKHVWEHVSPQLASTTYPNKPPIVGSGPFYTVAFKKGAYVEMVRNPYYWGKRPTVDKIFFEMYQDPATMVQDLKSGAIDAAWGIPEAQFKPLTSQAGIHTIAYNFFNWDYLDLNCSSLPGSTGNPVLRDVRFRDALNYAIDRNKLCQVAYDGLAAPATTIMPPDTWSNPDFHWQPSATEMYTYDLAKANQLLDAAGYRRGSNNLRLYRGKPITLRLWTTTDFPEGQSEAKMIAGSFEKLGLKINLAVIDNGAFLARMFNYNGSAFAPDFDIGLSDWAGYGDPGETLTSFTTAQIGGTNEPAWSNPTFDKLNVRQAAALDPTTRRNIIWQMQQIFYQQSPQIVLVYPQYLQAYDTTRWTGWTPMFHGRGPAWMTTATVDSYVNLKPAAAGAGSSGGARGTTIAIVAAIVVIAALVAVTLVRRRRVRAEEA